MESDLLVGQSMVEILNKTKQQFNTLIRTIHTAAIMASGTVTCDYHHAMMASRSLSCS